MKNRNGLTYGEWWTIATRGVPKEARPFKYGGGTGTAWRSGDDPLDHRAAWLAPAADHVDVYANQAALD